MLQMVDIIQSGVECIEKPILDAMNKLDFEHKIFILGSTRVGKSTTFAYLKGDDITLEVQNGKSV